MAAWLFGMWIVVSLSIWQPVAQQTGLVNDTCTEDETCKAVDTHSQCRDATCVCIPGYSRKNNRSCSLVHLNDSCLGDADCSAINGSACLTSGSDRKCLCVQGQTNDTSGSCRPIRLGDVCKSGADCNASIANAECLGRVCACSDGYRSTPDGKCVMNLVGDSCAANKDCLGLGGRSKCTNNKKCSCVGEYVERYNGTRCALRELGEFCGPQRRCHITFGECLPINQKDKSCQCLEGYTRETNISCRKKYIQELTCSVNAYCESMYNNTVCYRECESDNSCSPSSQGSCKCDEKRQYFLVGNECVYVGIGDPCTDDRDCRTEHNVCSSSMACVCNYTHVFNSEQKRCLPRRLLEGCVADYECSVENPNSYCSNDSSTCVCSPGFSMETARADDSPRLVCVRRVIGDHACEVDGDCLTAIANSTCGLCDDATDGSACKQRSCGNTENCSARTCLCQRGFNSDDGGTECRPMALSDECRGDVECRVHTPDSLCVTDVGSCPCPAGYARRNMTHCEKRDGCTNKDDCENSIINNECQSNVVYKKVCQCRSGYQGNHGRVECKRRQIGGDCEIREDCNDAVNGSDCRNGTCACNPGYKPGESRLTCERVRLYDACSESSVCRDAVKNSHCVEGKCQCLSGFSSAGNATSCLLRKINSPCQTVEDCKDAVANSYCNRSCQCNPGYYSSTNKTVCIAYTIGDRCTDREQCERAVNNSDCLSNHGNETVCMCRTGYQGNQSGSECRRRRVGDQCQLKEDCTHAVNDSDCRNGMCVCSPGFRSSYTHTECEKRALGHHCDSSIDCAAAVPNSACKDSACTCLPGHVRANETCIRRRIGDGDCSTAEDCLHAVNNSQCVEGLCRCPSGFSAAGNATMCEKRRLGSFCKTLDDCKDAVVNSYCSDGTCQCSLGHYGSGSGALCTAYRIGDPCTSDIDCSLIQDSTCVSSKCNCSKKHDAYNNGTECVLSPVTIWSGTCYFDMQCQKIHPLSYCNSANRLCDCPEVVAANRTSCLGLPRKLGDPCSKPNHCKDHMANTICSSLHSCVCVTNHIPYLNQSGCHPEPRQLGEYCLDGADCASVVNMSSCDVTNNTCVCSYGYRQEAQRKCIERDHLPVYQTVEPDFPVRCKDKCEFWNNSICETVNNASMCRCDHRHARRPGDSVCVPTQTYQINLHIVEGAGKYDYLPLNYNDLSRTEFATRVTVSGIQKIFENSHFSDRYVSSDVVNITNAGLNDSDTTSGVTVSILLHLTAFYLNATQVNYISDTIIDSITRAEGNLGDSLLKVSLPFKSTPVADYDECALKERNDCSLNANCLNTLGSFICICKPRFDDDSRNKSLRPGRSCVTSKPDLDTEHSEVCSSANCETKWGYVALALALFLLIVIIFITYEIIQRKQDFSARKLYEKFGTTKIRKLRQASMRRLQASKKKKDEEKKMKKEEAKKKKEEEKASKNEEKKVRKESKKFKKGRKSIKQIEEETENKDAAEEAGEIVHPPSLPFADDVVGADVSGLPGSLNTEGEMPSRAFVSHMEESPV